MFGGRGRGTGGGSGGGGGMLRNVGRTVTRVSVHGSGNGNAQHDPFSSSTLSSNSSLSRNRKPKTSNNPLSFSSSISSHNKNLISGLPFWHSSPDNTNDSEWVSVDHGIQDYDPRRFVGPVPSETEVQDAVSALQQVFGPASHVQLVRNKYYYDLDNKLDHVSNPNLVDQVSSYGSERGWAEPSLFPYNSKMLQADGFDQVYYAFHLLQTEPSVQRMVKSLSSDTAVWDAVLNNEVVRELRESIYADEGHVLQSADGTSNSDSLATPNVVMWIFDIVKAKFMEIIEKITKIVNELFQPADHKTATDAEGPDPFNEKLRTSFMLSIFVLLVVAVSRAQARASHN